MFNKLAIIIIIIGLSMVLWDQIDIYPSDDSERSEKTSLKNGL